jgi:hypothetical protein
MTSGDTRGRHERPGLGGPVRVLVGAVVALVALLGADAGGVAALPGRAAPAGWIRDGVLATEITVALAGLVVFTAIVALLARRLRRSRDEPPRVVIVPTTSRLTQAVVLVIALDVIAAPIVLLVATPRHPAESRRPPVVTTPAAPTATAPTSHPHGSAGNGGHATRDAALLALAAVVATAGAAAFARSRRDEELADEQQPPDDAGGDDEVRAGVAVAATAASAALDRVNSDPRAAVIAAYAAMTHTLTDASPQLRANDTPRRLLARAATAGIVDPKPARTLITLFAPARFSTRPVTPEHVTSAREALERVQASLIVRAGHR